MSDQMAPQPPEPEIADALYVVRGRLLEWLGSGSDDRDDPTPIEWLVRRYHGLQGTSARASAQFLPGSPASSGNKPRHRPPAGTLR